MKSEHYWAMYDIHTHEIRDPLNSGYMKYHLEKDKVLHQTGNTWLLILLMLQPWRNLDKCPHEAIFVILYLFTSDLPIKMNLETFHD